MLENIVSSIGKKVKHAWDKTKDFFPYVLGAGLIALPLTLKPYSKVKLPDYEQVNPTMLRRPEHKPKPQNLDNKINNPLNKEVKGDSLIKEWERTYDYGLKYINDGLEVDKDGDIVFGTNDGITWSYTFTLSAFNGDTIIEKPIIKRARSPPGTEEGDSGVDQVLVGPNNERIMVGMDWNYSENRNNLWIGTYSAAGDSLWFNYYNRDSTSSEFFLLQKPAAVFSDGSVVVSTRSNIYSETGGTAYNSWDFAVDTLGNILWATDRIDTTIEKNVPGEFNDLIIKNDTLIEIGEYYSTVTDEVASKFYKVNKDGNVINKKYINLAYNEHPSSVVFTKDNKLFISGYYDGSDGSGYYTPFVAELDPQTLDTLWLKTYEGGVYRDERVMDMATTSSYLFLAGYVNTGNDTTDTAAIWMVDTAGNYIGEFDRPNAIYTGATTIGDSLVFAYGRDEVAGKPLLVKYKLDQAGINENPRPKQDQNRQNLELKVLNNPSREPIIEVNKIDDYKSKLDNNVIVYDLLGRKVGSYQLNNGKTTLKGLRSGIYFVDYYGKKGKIVKLK